MITGVIQGSFLYQRPSGTAVRPASLPPPAVFGPHLGSRPEALVPAPPGRPVPVRGPSPPVQPPRGPAGAVFKADLAVLCKTGPAQSLPEPLRLQMERAFNTRFEGVRVHVGPQAASIGARAFTIGADLYFAPGHYQPQTAAGRQLIGHELAHVVQQRQGRVRNPLGGSLAIVQDPALEAEAERMGHRAAAVPTLPGRAANPPSRERSASRLGLRSGSVQRMKSVLASSPFPPFQFPELRGRYETWLDQDQQIEESGKVKRRLTLANTAISYARGKLPFGAPNIRAQLDTSLGWNHLLASDIELHAGDVLAKIGKKVCKKENIEKQATFVSASADGEFGEALNAAASRAIVARKLGAGVCDDFAAVVLFNLQKQVTGEDRLYRISVAVGNASHAVIVLGDADLNDNNLIAHSASVIVDAWPTSPFAVRAVDWVYRDQPIKIGFSLAGGEDYLKTVRSVYKAPYHYENEECYRGIGDIRGSATSYKDYMATVKAKRADAKSKLENSLKSARGGEWGQMWDDVDSLEGSIKQRLT